MTTYAAPRRHTLEALRRVILHTFVIELSKDYTLPSGNRYGKRDHSLLDSLEEIHTMLNTPFHRGDPILGAVVKAVNWDLEALMTPIRIERADLRNELGDILDELRKANGIPTVTQQRLASMLEEIESDSFKEELEAEFDRVKKK